MQSVAKMKEQMYILCLVPTVGSDETECQPTALNAWPSNLLLGARLKGLKQTALRGRKSRFFFVYNQERSGLIKNI